MRTLLAGAAAIVLAGCSGSSVSISSTPGGPFVLEWSANVTVSTVAAANAAAQAFSSSRLALSWSAPANLVPTRYDVLVTEVTSSSSRTVSTTATSLQLDGLKSATGYRFEVRACDAAQCYAQPAATSAAETPAEVWQLQGTGRSFAGLARVVADGNVKLHAMRIGEGAPADLAGRLRLYYGASGAAYHGLSVAVTADAAAASAPSTYLAFASRAGSAGLLDPPAGSALVRAVATGQGVPLSSSLGSRVRLFFEGLGADNRTRILWVDSHDGYAGLDFNAGAATTCSTAADYSPGGGCAPTVAIGVEGDATAGWARISNARQFKIGVPTASDWRWDGAAGTFMVFTVDAISGCTAATHNQAYAVWSGSAWQVQYDASGCPKMLASAQAAHPLHLGGVRYKLYYGDPSDATGRLPGSMLPFLGPKKLVYADGAASGDPARVDFEDWEPVSRGRPITFLWPDGAVLDATAEGYIDDFSVIAPTGSLALQVLYVAITDGTTIPFTAVAVLLNP
ncbi:MAG TPA: fibronectin type III domain-containing protein [Usitatibacter sp.]|nr:fibronectin type III domain-containing protein [Usitatibacter sp.]